MTKPDWAERKLMREYCIEDGEDGYRACLIPLATVAKLLRAERRRAVMVLQRLLLDEHGEQYIKGYNKAINDAIAAVRGEK